LAFLALRRSRVAWAAAYIHTYRLLLPLKEYCYLAQNYL
jgi:hypothetical protein